MRLIPLLLTAAAALVGCQQNIGDSCGSSSDCSVTGDRQCDLAQPGGYCTVFACDPDTCPQGACVEWRFVPSRTAETWCMKTCRSDDDCRRQYSCVFPEEIDMDGRRRINVPPEERIARIIDLNEELASSRICTALASDSEASELPLDTPSSAGLDGGT